MTLLALEQAKASYDKDLVYCLWLAKQEGIYVAINDSIQPNRYPDVPIKNIVTKSGIELILINQVYMTPQAHEQAKNKFQERTRT